MSDCPKCGGTPCECGHDGYYVIYKSEAQGLTKEEIINLIETTIKNTGEQHD
jgi:hypothetical protein